MAMIKLKLVMIGPISSGKSTIANFLSDATDTTGGDYRPTKGVRIVEFESQNLNINNNKSSKNNMKAEIELWDCSGDKRYQSCWPACCREANGIIFVYDASKQFTNGGADNDIHTDDNVNTELDTYYDHFVTQCGSGTSNCLVIANTSTQTNTNTINPTIPLSSKFSNLPYIVADIEEDSEKLRNNFNNYLKKIINNVQHKNEQDELNIINLNQGVPI